MNLYIKFLSLIAIVLFVFTNAFSQTENIIEEESYIAISVPQIPDHNRESRNRILELNQILLEEGSSADMMNKIKEISTEYDQVSANFDSLNIKDLNLESLDKWDRKWKGLNKRLDEVYKPITDKDEMYHKLYDEVDKSYHIWLETLISIKGSNVPDDLKTRIVQTKNDLRELRKQLKETQSYFLTIRTECNMLSNNIYSKKSKIRTSREDILKNLLVPERSVLWKAIAEYRKDTVKASQQNDYQDVVDTTKDYLKKNTSALFFIGIAFVMFLFAFFYLKRAIRKSTYYAIAIENKATRLIVNRPILTSFIITWIVIASFTNWPEMLKAFWIIIMLPMLLIVIFELFGKQSFLRVFIFLGYYLFRAIQFLIISNNPITRLVYLFIALFSAYLVLQIMKRVKFPNLTSALKGLVRFVLLLLLIVLIASFLFNIAGNVILANIMLIGSINAVLGGILYLAGYITVEALVKLLFNLPQLKYSNLVKNHYNSLFKQIKSILILVFLLTWLNNSLKSFGVREEVYDWFMNVLLFTFEVGSTSFSLSAIVAFILTIYFTIWLSKMIRLFLNEEIFERRNTPKGASGTITLVVRFSVFSLGFLMAMAFAGIELEKITIIIGALGVGIGFGLQNIFNNLISGLILAFERPIKIDDIIQVGELTGVVKDIGFRASTVRTYDGSEVIVPNGDIISNQMINWTLSDRKRRLKIDLSVAMDTKPEDVLEVLSEIAHENPDIVQDPAPRPRFLGYGEGTLDFQLLFWIADFDNSFGLGTETMLKLHNKIKERGIVIPYPQRNIKLVEDSGSLIKTKKDISE